MSQEIIREAMEEALCELHAVRGKIDSIRRSCKHPNVKKTHKSSTGNYCPQDDVYWTEFKCPDCGSEWSEDGSK